MNPKNPKIKKQPQQGEEKGKNQKFITDYEEKGNRGREKEERTLKISSSNWGRKPKGYRQNKVKMVAQVNRKEKTQSK